MTTQRYKLFSKNGFYLSDSKGTLGGYNGQGNRKYYGRLDCPSALNFIVRGHYVKHRVFFADEAVARAAGFRPCAKCMKAEFDAWKAARLPK